MAQITIRYLLSETGRKSSLLDGGDGKREQEINIDLTPELLALADVDDSGAACWRVGFLTPAHHRAHAFDAVQTVESLLAWQQEQAAAAAAAAEAERATNERTQAYALAWALAAPVADLISFYGSRLELVPWCAEFQSPEIPWKDPLLAAARAADVRAELARRETARQEQLAAAKRQEEAREAAKQLADAQAAEERAAWVTAHGSDRLKLALEMGMLDACIKVYLDERLATERPGGWLWEPAGVSVREVRNPTLEQLENLRATRDLYPDDDVTLDYLYCACEHNDHNDHRGDDEAECEDTWQGRALRAGYLGRVIYRMV